MVIAILESVLIINYIVNNAVTLVAGTDFRRGPLKKEGWTSKPHQSAGNPP